MGIGRGGWLSGEGHGHGEMGVGSGKWRVASGEWQVGCGREPLQGPSRAIFNNLFMFTHHKQLRVCWKAPSPCHRFCSAFPPLFLRFSSAFPPLGLLLVAASVGQGQNGLEGCLRSGTEDIFYYYLFVLLTRKKFMRHRGQYYTKVNTCLAILNVSI